MNVVSVCHPLAEKSPARSAGSCRLSTLRRVWPLAMTCVGSVSPAALTNGVVVMPFFLFALVLTMFCSLTKPQELLGCARH